MNVCLPLFLVSSTFYCFFPSSSSFAILARFFQSPTATSFFSFRYNTIPPDSHSYPFIFVVVVVAQHHPCFFFSSSHDNSYPAIVTTLTNSSRAFKFHHLMDNIIIICSGLRSTVTLSSAPPYFSSLCNY